VFSLGADDCLTKPFSPQELRVRVGPHLAKR
jgi:DNA-binding response OmpR family regulator